MVLVKYGTSRKVVGYGNRKPSGVSDVSAEASEKIGGADVVGGGEGGNSDSRVSRHQKLYSQNQDMRYLPRRIELLTGTKIRNPRYPGPST